MKDKAQRACGPEKSWVLASPFFLLSFPGGKKMPPYVQVSFEPDARSKRPWMVKSKGGATTTVTVNQVTLLLKIMKKKLIFEVDIINF